MKQEHEWTVIAKKEPPNRTLFSIPSYQRGYRWTKAEVEALLDDLLDFARTPSEAVYCLQPLVVQSLGENKYNVVDGQQRLTTLALILHALKMSPGWEVEYTSENGESLSELLHNPDPERSINDHFRCEAQKAIVEWLGESPERADSVRSLFLGEGGKRIVFLWHELSAEEDGHAAFLRLNALKTPLTSSELIRAFFMESGNGLNPGEKTDIAKEWDEIESATRDESFWAIWPTERFKAVPTRMDFLFSVVANVDGNLARQDPLAVYRSTEERATRKGLQGVWDEVLRCWWWMQSCHADPEAYHLLGWLALFTDREARVLYRDAWGEKSRCRMGPFKQILRKIVAESIAGGEMTGCELESFRYAPDNAESLRRVFVLLNMLAAQQQHIRFRFDLYNLDSWDVEHIAPQTDNLHDLQKNREDTVVDKDSIGNLALLDSRTNRSYKNAVYPEKRKRILLDAPADGVYIPPATAAAFAKTYSPTATQMRYWSETDATNYLGKMKDLFDGFMSMVKEESK